MEESKSFQEPPWIPQTPIKPNSPIYSNPADAEPRSPERKRISEKKDMNGLDHLSFGDLLDLANSASSFYFSGQTRNREMMGKGNNESIVVEEMIKTPEKPKRRKHRPKVVREAKPKPEPKPRTPRKPPVAAVDGQEKKTPRRKYVRKSQEVNKDQTTPVEEAVGVASEAVGVAKKICRRTLDFADETVSAQSGEKEPKDCLPTAPSTPAKRKRIRSKKKEKEKEPMYNQEELDLLTAQAIKKSRDINYLSGIEYNELYEYEKSHWLYFPTYQPYSYTPELGANRVFTMEASRFESNVRLDMVETPKKRSTTGHARVRNMSSINKIMEVSERVPIGSYGREFVDTRLVTFTKKKRATKSENSLTSQRTILPKPPGQYPTSFAGNSPEELWNETTTVEAIMERLSMLDINRESSETGLIPYAMKSGGNKIILFGGRGAGASAIVPLPPVRKRQVRPRVDLDNETDRVWKLLLENINSEGIDGSDEQKAKWWEEERNVFRGRADSFIARMHLVQGDRRFTPWKGSVVDSVVGVFLTQNVSDHLSSSAFMSLAAAYPAPSVPDDVGTSSVHSIRITYLDSEESMSNPPVHNQSSVTLNNAQPDEEKNHVNSNETSRSSSEIASSANESVGKTTDVVPDQKGSSLEVDQSQPYNVQDLFPSEDSALTYQNPKASSSEINSGGEHCTTSFVKLLQGLVRPARLQGEEGLQVSPNTSSGDCISEVKDSKVSYDSNEPCCSYQQDGDVLTKLKEDLVVTETLIPDINESTRYLDVQEDAEKPSGVDSRQHQESSCQELNPKEEEDATFDPKGKKVLKEKKEAFDWDSLRREAESREGKREKTSRTLDSVDWEAIRNAHVGEVAETIKSRGMNHKLAERIQGFLDRLVREHGSIDLEWLRDVPPDKAKEYLLSFRGLGLKSVECVRLLTLHHLAFPVDTNVGRIAVRLGWVPLQPLPESLQLHLLEMYPVLESIQKYLWPRLCKLDQKTLYELHYQMITFGKVFCTKSKPNCNACPMRGECRHFASAFASARLALPGTEKGIGTPDKNPLPLHLPEPLQREQGSEVVVKRSEPENKVTSCEPIIEEPASPEPECAPIAIGDIEDAFYEDPEEIPTIRLNMDAFTSNLKKIMEHNKEGGDMSTALVALTAEAASLPMPKLKNISQLRTEHQVYELPDSHPLLVEMEKREPDDPCSYLLAIWTPGETVDSIQPAVSKCISQFTGKLCDDETCFSCNNVKETRSQTVRGTILIPCRTAMRGSFPLNGTYFQVNEVFADHASSLNPIDVPRQWLWDLPRRTVYFGTSIPSIFKGLTTETIQQCFWRGYVCVRGFERKTRAPRPLIARLHFPASRMSRSQV